MGVVGKRGAAPYKGLSIQAMYRKIRTLKI
jgi:hypothetical protein